MKLRPLSWLLHGVLASLACLIYGVDALSEAHGNCDVLAPENGVCGVVAVFNPARFGSRWRNLERFRSTSRAQGLWLMVVELSFDGDFVAKAGVHAESVVRVQGAKGEHVMWQKERLLNQGVALLPAGCEIIIWPDADMLFSNDQWINGTVDALRHAQVVQPFQYVLRLGEGQDWMDPQLAPVSSLKQEGVRHAGVAEIVQQARSPSHRQRVLRAGSGYTGYAWAAKASFFEKVALYDASIVGGGDTLMAYAFEGYFDRAESAHSPPAYYQARFKSPDAPFAVHYRKWATLAYAEVSGQVASVEGTALHIWHGSKSNRQYQSRFEPLKKVDFDPERHLVLDAVPSLLVTETCSRPVTSHIWAWSDAAGSELRNAVRDMFLNRFEDGLPHERTEL